MKSKKFWKIVLSVLIVIGVFVGSVFYPVVSLCVAWFMIMSMCAVIYNKNEAQYETNFTPIYDVTLKWLGFKYNQQMSRWQIGCIGAPCMVFCTRNSDGVYKLECRNFESGNDEYDMRIVRSVEDINAVFISCGLSTSMIEKAQDVWK